MLAGRTRGPSRDAIHCQTPVTSAGSQTMQTNELGTKRALSILLMSALAMIVAPSGAWAGSNPNTDAATAGGQVTDTAIVTLVDQATASYDGHIAGLAR